MGGRDGGGKREGVHMSVQADVWVEVAERKRGCPGLPCVEKFTR